MQRSILIHNPRCSKSRSAKKILEERGVEFVTIDYLESGIDEKLLLQLPRLLKLPFEQIIRTQESIYSVLKLSDKSLTDKEWITILLDHPLLLERPIFIHGDQAVVGRPPDLVLEIL